MSDRSSDATADSGGPAPTAAGSRYRRWGLTAIQWGIALGAFWYVARDVDWGATAAQLADVSPVVLGGIGLVTTLEFGSRFSMWYVLLNGRRSTSIATAARIDLVVKFINHLVPSKASGHSIAPLVVRHYTGIDWADSVTVAALNTGLYATLYGAVALLGVALFATQLSGGLLVVLALSTGLYVAAGVTMLVAGRRLELAAGLFAALERLVARVPRIGERLATLVGKAPSFTEESARIFRGLSTNPRVVIPYSLGWAGTLMVFPALRVWLLLTALGGGFSPAVLLPVVLVLAYSVTVLPLTPGGVGVAEASATLVLAQLGVGADVAAAVVLVDRSLGVYLPALLGAVPMGQLDLRELLASED